MSVSEGTRLVLERGRFRAFELTQAADRAAALVLRSQCFRGGAPDGDAYDADCRHFGILDLLGDKLVCCFRLMLLAPAAMERSYSAQSYDLAGLRALDVPMIELGRFCIAPGAGAEADILRLAWALVTAQVDRFGAEWIFGCSSFAGVEAAPYGPAFAWLGRNHLGAIGLRPGIGAPQVIAFEQGGLTNAVPDPVARGALPPLLRSYLGMGGWVSDHAVVDLDLGTLHVFTALEVAAVPKARARLLRAISSE